MGEGRVINKRAELSQDSQALSTTPSIIRALIVDDHPVVRYGIKHMLDAEPDIEVVGELEHIKGVGAVLSQLQPDVVLLDLELEETHGVDALRSIREECQPESEPPGHGLRRGNRDGTALW